MHAYMNMREDIPWFYDGEKWKFINIYETQSLSHIWWFSWFGDILSIILWRVKCSLLLRKCLI